MEKEADDEFACRKNTRTHTHKHTCTSSHTCTHTHMHYLTSILTHTHTHALAHTHTPTHALAHTHTRTKSSSYCWCRLNNASISFWLSHNVVTAAKKPQEKKFNKDELALKTAGRSVLSNNLDSNSHGGGGTSGRAMELGSQWH